MWVWIRQQFPGYDMKNTSNKRKHRHTDIIKIKNLCASRTPSRKWKDNPQNGRKLLQVIYLVRDLYLDYIKNYNSVIKRWLTQLKIGQNNWIDFFKGDTQMANENSERYSTSLVIREIETETTMRGTPGWLSGPGIPPFHTPEPASELAKGSRCPDKLYPCHDRPQQIREAEAPSLGRTCSGMVGVEPSLFCQRHMFTHKPCLPHIHTHTHGGTQPHPHSQKPTSSTQWQH